MSIGSLLDTQGFTQALRSGRPLVITDTPTSTVTLHRHPQDCPWVSERSFATKVVENRGRNGGYFVVDDETAAKGRWPDVVVCSRCAGVTVLAGRRRA
jgi:hypothetical protein